VDEDDQPQPPGRGHQHLRHGGGDEGVDQQQGAVRHARHHAGQGRCGDGVGPGPGTGDGVLADLPADRGEPGAEPPVVDVAAARPGRVVNAVGDHDVHHAHSARS
jgi:hypothetical protein